VSFVNVGTPENATFNISIPRGDVGPKGDTGDTGPAGEPGGSASILTYKAITNTNLPDSSIGHLVWNTAGQINATLIYLSHRQVGGQDVERILELATVGSTLLVQAQTNSGQYQTFTLLESPVATPGEYVTFSVVYVSGGGALFTNNSNLLVSIITKGAPGPEGPPGEAGPPGETGAQGDPGPAGDAATISVGTTTTTAAGTNASVTAVGTTSAQIFNFEIPRGDTGVAGPPGAQGDPGPAGAAATIAVGSTTTTAAGTSASVTSSGPSSALILDFSIPRGDTGVPGATGAQGDPGVPGTAATLDVGTTTTGAAGSAALVTQGGTSSARIFNFTIPTGPQGPPGPAGEGATYISFLRSTNNETAGFYTDSYVNIGWNPTSNEIMMRQPTARANVYAQALSIFGGSFPSGQNMLLSTTSNDFYFQSSFGQIDFTIASDFDHTHPFYMVRVLFTSSSGTAYVYVVVHKYTPP
jgi:hypothetical protein